MSDATARETAPAIALEAALKPTSTSIDLSSHLTVRGYDFNKSETVDYYELLRSYSNTGFQATHFGQACQQIESMLDSKSVIFFGYTSNLVSSGCRDIIRYLCQHKLVNALVTTAGGVEEDFIKCLAPTYIGEFTLNGQQLRANGINRIGNLLVPNDNYCKFEDWLMPIFDRLVDENENGGVLTPSKLIERLGREINHEDSIYYWCAKNGIPVFCPAITDGSLGDMLYFHSYRKPGLKIDILEDLKRINNLAVHAASTGMLILGGGIVKHHICKCIRARHAIYSLSLSAFRQRQSDAQRRGLRRVHQHGSGIRRVRCRCQSRRGDLMGQNPVGGQASESSRRRHVDLSIACCPNIRTSRAEEMNRSLSFRFCFFFQMYSIRPHSSPVVAMDLPTKMYPLRSIIEQDNADPPMNESLLKQAQHRQDTLLTKIQVLLDQLGLYQSRATAAPSVPVQEELVVHLSVTQPSKAILNLIEQFREQLTIRTYRHSSIRDTPVDTAMGKLSLNNASKAKRTLTVIWADGADLPFMFHSHMLISKEQDIVNLLTHQLGTSQ